MIQDFQHVCITCHDIERSVRFYEKLGLKVTDPVREFDDEALARTFQMPRGHIKVLHLAPPNSTSGVFIDLVQWWDPCSAGEPYSALNHLGITRLAFRVSDINATTATMRERGVVFLTEEPQSFGPIRTIIMSDPDGVFIQLFEWL